MIKVYGDFFRLCIPLSFPAYHIRQLKEAGNHRVSQRI